MAESFAFDIAEKVLGKLGSRAYREICLAWGVEGDLNKLEETLSTIKAVLLDAEVQQEKNHELSIWLRKLKDVCYEADDVLDEFEYEALWQQVVNRGGTIRKVRNFFSCSNLLVFRFKMGHKIIEVKEQLDEIAAEKAKLHLTNQVESRRVVHMERETHSFVLTSDVSGRDDDKQNIINLVMHPSDRENVSIIPIVGIGGLGKTTLAKLVYNDEMVVKNFQLRMWICVSDDFDIKKLTKNILSSASGTEYGDLTLDQMQTRLRDTLSDKKYLLILDDVWNEEQAKWVELKNLLAVGVNGSKIIVTTRSRLVASIMGTIPAYNLEGLSHDNCLSLFVKWAFRDGKEKLYLNLLKIGDDIVRKCSGVPLAVRTLGSLLYSKTNERDWLSIKDNEIWKLKQKENDTLPALKLSYDAMPDYLKQCFAFCSIFRTNCEIGDLRLIYLWMAQGFLQFSNENLELEDIGQQCINDLKSRSFLQDFELGTTSSRFRINDLAHDLASSVAKAEISSFSFRTHINITNQLRHVAFYDDSLYGQQASTVLHQLHNNVRTIIWRAELDLSDSHLETLMLRCKCLRVLDLSNSKIEVLPSSISKLKHLRYLDLSKNGGIKKLPSSICKLVNLQTLILIYCEELEELPKDIGNLINLRVLHFTTKQMVLPEKGIGCLRALRFLGMINCHNLKSLSEGMQSLTALQRLDIADCESLESFPHSMKCLTTLETLLILGCEKLNIMELEKHIQGLRLRLRSLIIGMLPLVALPLWLQHAENTLQHIWIAHLYNLTELPEWLQNLTSLQKLQIEFCPKLSALPEGMHGLTALRELVIAKCPELIRRCKRETGTDWPKIAHVPKITLVDVSSDDEEEEEETDNSVSC